MTNGRAERTSEVCPTDARRNGKTGSGFRTALDPQNGRRGRGPGQVELLYRFPHSVERFADVVQGHFRRGVVVQSADPIHVDPALVEVPTERPSQVVA